MKTLYFVRHGEVHNPTGIVYGRLPGFGLSNTGKTQISLAIEKLKINPPQVVYASPMQRTQESAGLIASNFKLEIQTDSRIIETKIGSFQGKPFDSLPKPYITDEGTHPDIESANDIRKRLFDFVDDLLIEHANKTVVAVSHRDPIVVAILYWQERPIENLTAFDFAPGSIFAVHFEETIKIERLI